MKREKTTQLEASPCEAGLPTTRVTVLSRKINLSHRLSLFFVIRSLQNKTFLTCTFKGFFLLINTLPHHFSFFLFSINVCNQCEGATSLVLLPVQWVVWRLNMLIANFNSITPTIFSSYTYYLI